MDFKMTYKILVIVVLFVCENSNLQGTIFIKRFINFQGFFKISFDSMSC